MESLDKYQIPSTKFQISTNFRNSKENHFGSLETGDWNLSGIWNLFIGISPKDAYAEADGH
jgi:hypothetical protein